MTFWHDQQLDLLIYPGQPGAIADAVPEVQRLNGSYFALPRTLRNSQVLRYFNYPVPPIVTEANYDFPRPPNIKRPYESQIITTNFMILHRRCFCLSDMGTGKTAATLWASDWLMRQYPKGQCKALIVAPLSVLQRVWGDAIFKAFLGKRTYAILHGSQRERLAQLDRDVDFFIVNVDGVGVGAHTRKKFELDGFSKALAQRGDIRLAVVDEASAYKDARTKRHRIAREVFARKDYLWLLTGTPTPNAPTDAYGLAKLVNNAYGKSFKTFQEATMYKPYEQGFKWLPRKDGYEQAAQLLSPSIRFDIRDVWDAPEIVTQQHEVELTDQQQQALKELKANLQVTLKSGQISAVNEAAARSKFLQISLGAVYDDEHDVHNVDAEPRYAEFESLLEQSPGKWLVFASFTSALNKLYRRFRTKYNCALVRGGVTPKERTEIFSAFQEGDDLQIIFADPGTMGHGIDLFRARTVVWFSPVDRAEIYAQANKRAHRPGQKYPVSIVQIVSNKLEIEIFRRLENNLSLQGTLLDMASRGEL